ncbi:MAG: hypothetical protein IPJ07_20515 [Acidobacteria bacterium]|nr:hypothetical protein [Acidobacteriota bacterium]
MAAARGGGGVASALWRRPRPARTLGEYIVKLTVRKEMTKPSSSREDPRIRILPTTQKPLGTLLSINKIQKSGGDAQARLTNLQPAYSTAGEQEAAQCVGCSARRSTQFLKMSPILSRNSVLRAVAVVAAGVAALAAAAAAQRAPVEASVAEVRAAARVDNRGNRGNEGNSPTPAQPAQGRRAGKASPPNFTQMMQNESAGPGGPNRMNALMPRIGQLYSGLGKLYRTGYRSTSRETRSLHISVRRGRSVTFRYQKHHIRHSIRSRSAKAD